MKRTLLTLLTLLSISASLAWGTCSSPSCTDHSPELPSGDLRGPTAPTTGTEAPRGTSRSFSADDFLTSEGAPEKPCSGADCREPRRPPPEPRSLDSKEGDGKDGMLAR